MTGGRVIPEALRPLGWLAIAVAGVLLSRAVAFDRDWLQLTELVLAAVALAVGLSTLVLTRSATTAEDGNAAGTRAVSR